MSYDKGARRERELVNELESLGFAAMRAPASGGGTKRELPDILAGNGDSFYAIEVKSCDKDEKYIYIPKVEVVDLNFFAENFGAKSILAARWDYKPWAFFRQEDLHETNKNFRIDKVKLSEGLTLVEL